MLVKNPKRHRDSAGTRAKLLDAARDVIRSKGYGATTVDDICRAAGVTKGSFFHHFASKDQLAVAAAEQFGATAATVFASAPYRTFSDPRDRVLGYVDFRTAMLEWDIVQYTCLLGTMVQEVYSTHPDVRAACDRQMSDHVAELAKDLADAKKLYAADASWSPESVGYFMQAALQGAFVFAKAKQSPDVAGECLAHLRRYLETLFSPSKSKKTKKS